MQQLIIAPSILAADFARLGEEVQQVLAAGAALIHFDVMDNHYVPNLTVGPQVCQALRNYGIQAPIEVHLMAKPVDELIVKFAQAGATYLTFHPEASEHLDRSLQLVLDSGCKAGLVFNPTTALNYLDYVWDKLSIVGLMAVNPGFGGQQFLPGTLAKLREVRALLDQHYAGKAGARPLLEVDGGVGLSNIKQVVAAGAEVLVMGSAIFQAGADYQTTLRQLRQELNGS